MTALHYAAQADHKQIVKVRSNAHFSLYPTMSGRQHQRTYTEEHTQDLSVLCSPVRVTDIMRRRSESKRSGCKRAHAASFLHARGLQHLCGSLVQRGRWYGFAEHLAEVIACVAGFLPLLRAADRAADHENVIGAHPLTRSTCPSDDTIQDDAGKTPLEETSDSFGPQNY